MDKQYRTYPEEFKLEALELLRTSGKRAAEVERELGITKGLLLRWRDRYQVKESNGKAELAPSDLDALHLPVGDGPAGVDHGRGAGLSGRYGVRGGDADLTGPVRNAA